MAQVEVRGGLSKFRPPSPFEACSSLGLGKSGRSRACMPRSLQNFGFLLPAHFGTPRGSSASQMRHPTAARSDGNLDLEDLEQLVAENLAKLGASLSPSRSPSSPSGDGDGLCGPNGSTT